MGKCNTSRGCWCAGSLAILAIILTLSGIFLQHVDFNASDAGADLNLVIPTIAVAAGGLCGVGAIKYSWNGSKVWKYAMSILLFLIVGAAIMSIYSHQILGTHLSGATNVAIALGVLVAGTFFITGAIVNGSVPAKTSDTNDVESVNLDFVNLQVHAKADHDTQPDVDEKRPEKKPLTPQRLFEENKASHFEKHTVSPEDGTYLTIGNGNPHQKEGVKGKIVGRHANGGVMVEYYDEKKDNKYTTCVGAKYIPKHNLQSALAAADEMEYVKTIENPEHFTQSKLLKPTGTVMGLLRKLKNPTDIESAQKMQEKGLLTPEEFANVERIMKKEKENSEKSQKHRRLANRLKKMMTL